MRKVSAVGALAAVAALVLTTGCRGGDSPDGGIGPDDLPVDAAKETAQPGDAADRLADAIARVMESGRYQQTVTIPGLDEPYYEVTGAYDVDDDRFTADMAFFNSEVGDNRTIKHTVVEQRGFQQAEGWDGGAAGCWLTFDPDSLSSAASQTGSRSVRAPGAVLALDGARGRTTSGPDADVIEGTVQLRTAVSLMLPGFVRQQGTPPHGAVPASFTIDDDGALVGWTVLGGDVVSALDRAGADLQDSFAAGLDTFTLEVTYDDLGEPVAVQQPPRTLWMSPREMKAGGCAAD